MDVKTKELLSNTVLFTIANMGSKILVFLMVPFYTYVLTPREYGIAGVVQTTASLFFPILTLKLQDAVLRFCFKKELRKDDILSIGVVIGFIGVVISAVLAFIFRYIPLFGEVGWFIFFLPFIHFAHTFSQLFSFFARGINNVRASAISGLISTLFVVCLNLIFLLLFHTGVAGYLLSFAIADTIAAIYLFFSCGLSKYVSGKINQPLTREMLIFSVPLIPTSLSWWMLGSFNNYCILSILGAASVGIYTASMRVPSILTALADIFSQAWLLSALKNYETEEGRGFIRSVHRKFFSVLCFLTGGITLLCHPIAKILLSGEFSNSWQIIPLLFVAVFFGSLTGFYGSIFSAENKTTIHFTSTITGSIVSVTIVLCLLHRFGLMIVPVGTLSGYFTIWLIRKIKLNDYIDIGFTTIEAVFMGGLLVAIAVLVIFEQYLYAIIIYVLILFLCRKPLYSVCEFGKAELYSFIRNRIFKK